MDTTTLISPPGSPVISKDFFKMVLSDSEVMSDVKQILVKIYESPNHEASSKQLAAELGLAGTGAVNGKIVGLGMRVVKKFKIQQRIRERGDKAYWDIFFVGYYKGTSFIWRLRSELKQALEETDLLKKKIQPNQEINQEERSFRCWTFLTTCAKNRSLPTYGDVGNALKIHHRAVRYVLEKIQQYCLDNKLPPLTIIVINQGTGKPGAGFIAWDVENVDEGIEKVYAENWDNVENPFQYAKDGFSEEELIDSIVSNPEHSSDVFAIVKVRGVAQRIFRDGLLRTYSEGCAICGLSFTAALEAAHIIPYSDSTKEQKLDLRNGLLLCSTHHRLFDKRLIQVNQDYSIAFSESLRNGGEYDTLLTTKLDGKYLRLPKNQKHYPNKEWLSEHKNKLGDSLIPE